MHQRLAKLKDHRVSGIQRDVHLCAQNEILLWITLRGPVKGGSATKGVACIERSPNTELASDVIRDLERIPVRIVEISLRTSAPPKRLAKSQGFLLPRYGVRAPLVLALQSALAQAAKRAGCSTHVTPHRLRHSFATEMLRLGVSLPALMKLLGLEK